MPLSLINGTSAGETINGTGVAEEIHSGQGNDTVNAGGGNDVIYADDNTDWGSVGDNDTINGGGGDDTIYSSYGTDVLVGSDGDDTFVVVRTMAPVGGSIDGGTGTDTLTGELGTDFSRTSITGVEILSTSSNIFLTTAQLNSFQTLLLYHGAEIDLSSGGEVNLIGKVATDYSIKASDLGNTIRTGSTFQNIQGGAGNDKIYAGGGDDALTGNAGADFLYGEDGNDSLDGGAGADTMVGGLGNDVYVVDNTGDIVRETAVEGQDAVNSSISYVLGDNIEALSLAGSANINATGNVLGNILVGNVGNNILDGKAGDDILIGGLGNDTYVVDNISDMVIEYAGQGTDTVRSSIDMTLQNDIENLTLTGSGNLTATGNALANVLTGNSGNNVLNGGTGADTLIGGAGNDVYYIDSFSDVVTELKNGGTDTVISSVQYIMGGSYVENATLTGTLNSYAVGNALDNILFGNSGNNNLTGGAGNDRLDGGAGSDGLRGGVGNDVYYVDNLGDFIVENKDEGTDLVYSTVSFNLGAQYIENLTLRGTENINGLGNALANTITGNAGNNTLDGRAGNDTLTGGGGADIFFFGAGSGKDTITDFSASQNDSLNLHAYNQATAVITQVGSNTVIDLGGGNIITLTGATKADVTSHITW